MTFVVVLPSSPAGAVRKASPPRSTTITVSLGSPAELGFTLSKFSLIPGGKLTFKVVDKGVLMHDFKLCTTPAKTSAANACAGKATNVLKPGQSATLVVSVPKTGTYEYLCTVPGHAASGMKGLLGVGVKVAGAKPSPSTSSGGSTTTTGGTTTGPASAPEALVGDPVAGASVFASGTTPNCGSCHTLRAAGATGTIGPSLDIAKPGQQTVIQFVTNGSGVMPSFSGQLNPKQMSDLAAYVYQSTR
jgi:mono/diheme cytochrome c family protein